MSNSDLITFGKRFESWELTHPRQWIATTDKNDAASFISAQANKIANAQLEAADRIIVSQDRIASGIDEIAFDINRIADGIEELASVFEWGFSELIWQIEQEREVLREILKTLQAPLDTQSKELRKRAEEAYKNGWIDDAFEDFRKSQEKNRYDFTIYQSLGNIYLFHKKNSEKALKYYEKAAKYATPYSSLHTSIAFLHIGLVKYLQADFQKAYEMTLKAIELSPNFYEAHYQHAQYCANIGKYDEAIEHLKKAIDGDRYYCVKIDSEKDFNVMKNQLRLFFKELQNKAQSQAEHEIKKAKELIKEAKSYEISSKFNDKFKSAEKKLDEAITFLKRESLFDCWDAYYKALPAQKIAMDSSIGYLSNQVENLYKQIRELPRNEEKVLREIQEKEDSLAWIVFRIVTFLFIIACIYIIIAAILDRGNLSIFDLILGLISVIFFMVLIIFFLMLLLDVIISTCLKLVYYPKKNYLKTL